jgi:hypothetical protein
MSLHSLKLMIKSLPKELEEKIIEMLDSSYHCDKMKIVNREFFKNYISFMNKHIYKISHKCSPFTLVDTMDASAALYCIETVTRCECCSEHQSKRPTVQMYLDYFIPEYPVKKKRPKPCKCPCRHLARMICREMNDPEWFIDD